MSESTTSIANRALGRANEAHGKIEAHEELCAERYQNIHDKLRTITGILGWGGTTMGGIMLTVIAFLAVRVLDAPNVENERLKAQVEILQQQASHRGGSR